MGQTLASARKKRENGEERKEGKGSKRKGMVEGTKGEGVKVKEREEEGKGLREGESGKG